MGTACEAGAQLSSGGTPTISNRQTQKRGQKGSSMIRGLFILFCVTVVYYALKTVFRSAVRSYHEEDRKSDRLMGEEMIQDPECRTYIPKDRAITRRIGGKLCSFCSETCAKRYEEKIRT
jgi:uncharacterized protein